MPSSLVWCLILEAIVARGYINDEPHCEDERDASVLLQRSSRGASSEASSQERRLGNQPSQATEPEPTQPAQPTQPLELVHEVYTYGASATHAFSPLQNAARMSGCFPGLRSFTEDKAGAFGEIRLVDAASIFIPYPHAFISALVLHGGEDSLYAPCQDVGSEEGWGHPEWPQRQGLVVDRWSLHHENSYVSRLDNVSVDGANVTQEEPFASARFFSRLAFRSYDSFEVQKAAVANDMPGWRLVHRADDKHYTDVDPVLVVQEEATLSCALVFTGTNDPTEYATSITRHGVEFCGFQDVHFGYRNELRELTRRLWPSMRPTLEQCSRVVCVGHSLGGSLCELFAACANSGNVTDPDYQLMAWTPSPPQLQGRALSVDEPWRNLA